jgi:hypothetical protein
MVASTNSNIAWVYLGPTLLTGISLVASMALLDLTTQRLYQAIDHCRD